MRPNNKGKYNLGMYLPVGRVMLNADTANKMIDFRYSLDQDLDVKTKKGVKVYKTSI